MQSAGWWGCSLQDGIGGLQLYASTLELWKGSAYIDYYYLVYPIGITNINYIDALLMPYWLLAWDFECSSMRCSILFCPVLSCAALCCNVK